MIVKSVGNKSGNKIFIIQSIDRKMDFEDIARAKDLDFDELLTEIEGIVNSGTRLDISYYLRDFMDEDKIEDHLPLFQGGRPERFARCGHRRTGGRLYGGGDTSGAYQIHLRAGQLTPSVHLPSHGCCVTVPRIDTNLIIRL